MKTDVRVWGKKGRDKTLDSAKSEIAINRPSAAIQKGKGKWGKKKRGGSVGKVFRRKNIGDNRGGKSRNSFFGTMD